MPLKDDTNCKEELFLFQWHITDKCNLSCKHCYQNYSDKHQDIQIEKLLYIADVIDSTCNKWEMQADISISGGEPFTRKNDLYTLLQYLSSKENVAKIFLMSNGLAITQKDIITIKKIKKLTGIQVSLEGHNKNIHDFIRGNGTFDRTIQAINLLKSNDIKVSVMLTLSKWNYKYVKEVYELLSTLKVDDFAIDRFIPEQGNTTHHFSKNALNSQETYEAYKTFDLLYESNCKMPKLLPYSPLFCLFNKSEKDKKGASCSVGINLLTILPNGDLFPCRRLPIRLGNILTDNLFEIWYNNDLLWDIRNKKNLKGKCNNCEFVNDCSGCRAMAYASTSDYLMEDSLCWK